MASKGVVWDTDHMQKRIVALPVLLEAGLSVVAERVADESQDFARVNAPWEDQTTNARGGLFAKAINNPGRHVVVVYHTMPYGVWLELRWNGKFGIIPETIQHGGLRMMQYADQLLGRLAA